MFFSVEKTVSLVKESLLEVAYFQSKKPPPKLFEKAYDLL